MRTRTRNLHGSGYRAQSEDDRTRTARSRNSSLPGVTGERGSPARGSSYRLTWKSASPTEAGQPSIENRKMSYLAPAVLGLLLAIPLVLTATDAGAVPAPDPTYAFAVGLSWAIVVLAAGRLAWLFAQGYPSLVDAMFWVFVYAAAGVPGLIQLNSMTFPWRVEVSSAERLLAALMVLSAMAGWYLCIHWLHTRTNNAVPVPRRKFRAISLPRLWLVFAAYLVLLPGLLSLRGGLGALFLARNDSFEAADFDSLALAGLVVVALRGVPVVLLAAGLRYNRAHGGGAGPLIVLVTPIALITNNPISTNRYWLIAALGMVFLSASGLGANSRKAVVFSSVLLALFAFPVLDAFRRTTSPSLDALGPLGLDALKSGDYDTIHNAAMGAGYVADNGFSWGYQLLGPLFFWVPRTIWPGKPEATGAIVAEHSGLAFTRISGPMWVDGYMAAGLLGCAVLAAGVAGLAHRVETAGRHGSEFSLLVACFLVGYILIIVRGSLLQAVSPLAAVVVLSLLVTAPRQGQGSTTSGAPRESSTPWRHRRRSAGVANR